MSSYSEFRRRNEDTGQWQYFCPEESCVEVAPFDSLYLWKGHMSREHGGFTSSDVEQTVERPSGQKAGAEGTSVSLAGVSAPAKPKKLSGKARELNEKVNRAINLCLKHFIDGLSEEERKELGTLRGEVSVAFMGIEFDFEEKLFAISGKWALLIVISALFVIPQIPPLKELMSKAKDSKAKKGAPGD